jgi:hypothetical protein
MGRVRHAAHIPSSVLIFSLPKMVDFIFLILGEPCRLIPFAVTMIGLNSRKYRDFTLSLPSSLHLFLSPILDGFLCLHFTIFIPLSLKNGANRSNVAIACRFRPEFIAKYFRYLQTTTFFIFVSQSISKKKRVSVSHLISLPPNY